MWGRFSGYQKVLWFTTAGEPQHDPKRNDTWLCAWRFGQVHAGWFMPASSPRSPGENIDCFFFFSAEGKWEAAISLFWEPVQMELAKMQTLLTGSIFLQPNACSQKKFNRLLYWFVIPLQAFVCRLNILTRQVLSDSVLGHSFGNAYVCIARLMAYWDNISNDHLPSYTAVLIWSYFLKDCMSLRGNAHTACAISIIWLFVFIHLLIRHCLKVKHDILPLLRE